MNARTLIDFRHLDEPLREKPLEFVPPDRAEVNRVREVVRRMDIERRVQRLEREVTERHG